MRQNGGRWTYLYISLPRLCVSCSIPGPATVSRTPAYPAPLSCVLATLRASRRHDLSGEWERVLPAFPVSLGCVLCLLRRDLFLSSVRHPVPVPAPYWAFCGPSAWSAGFSGFLPLSLPAVPLPPVPWTFCPSITPSPSAGAVPAEGDLFSREDNGYSTVRII